MNMSDLMKKESNKSHRMLKLSIAKGLFKNRCVFMVPSFFYLYVYMFCIQSSMLLLNNKKLEKLFTLKKDSEFINRVGRGGETNLLINTNEKPNLF